jgi:hypothetical protein
MPPIWPTLLLSPRRTPDATAVQAAAWDAGWVVIPALGWRQCGVPGPRADVAVYGEPSFATWVARREGLTLLWPQADWLCGLPWRYRKRKVRHAMLAEARAEAGPVFVKDALLDRLRSAVYPSGAALPDGVLPVLVSEQVCWDVEVRFFVLERAVTTFAPYAGNAPAPVLGQAVRFMEEFLGDRAVALPPAVVVDVGWITGRGWAVVEANPAWSSALYGCDPRRVLPVLARAAVLCDRRTEADRSWASNGGLEDCLEGDSRTWPHSVTLAP